MSDINKSVDASSKSQDEGTKTSIEEIIKAVKETTGEELNNCVENFCKEVKEKKKDTRDFIQAINKIAGETQDEENVLQNCASALWSFSFKCNQKNIKYDITAFIKAINKTVEKTKNNVLSSQALALYNISSKVEEKDTRDFIQAINEIVKKTEYIGISILNPLELCAKALQLFSFECNKKDIKYDITTFIRAINEIVERTKDGETLKTCSNALRNIRSKVEETKDSKLISNFNQAIETISNSTNGNNNILKPLKIELLKNHEVALQNICSKAEGGDNPFTRENNKENSKTSGGAKVTSVGSQDKGGGKDDQNVNEKEEEQQIDTGNTDVESSPKAVIEGIIEAVKKTTDIEELKNYAKALFDISSKVKEKKDIEDFTQAINEIVQKTEDKGVLKNCAECLAVMKTWLEGYEPKYNGRYLAVEPPVLKHYISAINGIVQKTKDKGVLKNCAEYLAVMEKWICISHPYTALYIINAEDLQNFILAIIKIAESEAIKEKDTLNNCLKSLSSIEYNVSDIMNRGPKPYEESVCMHNYLLAIKTIFEKIENNQDALYIFASGLGRRYDILMIHNQFKSDIKGYILLIKAIVEKIEVKKKSDKDFENYKDALEQCLKFSGSIFSEVNGLEPECIKDCVLTIYNIMVEKKYEVGDLESKSLASNIAKVRSNINDCDTVKKYNEIVEKINEAQGKLSEKVLLEKLELKETRLEEKPKEEKSLNSTSADLGLEDFEIVEKINEAQGKLSEKVLLEKLKETTSEEKPKEEKSLNSTSADLGLEDLLKIIICEKSDFPKVQGKVSEAKKKFREKMVDKAIAEEEASKKITNSTRTEPGEQKNLKDEEHIKEYINEGTIPTNVESNESAKKQIEIINAADQSGLQKLSERVNEVYERNCQEVKYTIEEKDDSKIMTITGYQEYDKITVKANKEQSLSEMYLAVVQKILYGKQPEGIEIEGLEEYNASTLSLPQKNRLQNTTLINRRHSNTVVLSPNEKQQLDSKGKEGMLRRTQSLSICSGALR